jgi:hypothetical protein
VRPVLGPACVRRHVRRVHVCWASSRRAVALLVDTEGRPRVAERGPRRACMRVSSVFVCVDAPKPCAPAHSSTASCSSSRRAAEMWAPASSRPAGASRWKSYRVGTCGEAVSSSSSCGAVGRPDPPPQASRKRVPARPRFRRLAQRERAVASSAPSPSSAPEAPARGWLGATRWEGTEARAGACLGRSRAGWSSSGGD